MRGILSLEIPLFKGGEGLKGYFQHPASGAIFLPYPLYPLPLQPEVSLRDHSAAGGRLQPEFSPRAKQSVWWGRGYPTPPRLPRLRAVTHFGVQARRLRLLAMTDRGGFEIPLSPPLALPQMSF